MSMLTTRLPEDINQRLNALSVKTGRTKSFYVREALELHMQDLEDAYLAEAALIKHKKSGKTVSHQELGAELGFLDD